MCTACMWRQHLIELHKSVSSSYIFILPFIRTARAQKSQTVTIINIYRGTLGRYIALQLPSSDPP